MIENLFYGFSHVLVEVFFALIPLVVFFALFQLIYLKLPLKRLLNIGVGIILTFFGLAFFLQGVHIGFLPAGEAMGQFSRAAKQVDIDSSRVCTGFCGYLC